MSEASYDPARARGYQRDAEVIEAQLDQISRGFSASDIEDPSVAFAETSAEINRLMTRTLLLAQRAVDAAVAEAERRAQVVIKRAEDHARIVAEHARAVIEDGLDQQRAELLAEATRSHAYLLSLLERALDELDHKGSSIRRPADAEFFAELREAVSMPPPTPLRRRPSA